MATNNVFILTALAAVLLIVAWFFVSVIPARQTAAITNFDDCAAAGYPVMESYPRQCAANGETFVEEVASSGMPLPTGFNGCAVSGCSGQLCVSADEAGNIYSTCEYRPEYVCYTEASCEPQADGRCGWTQTQELKKCLANPPVEVGGPDAQAI